MFYYLAAQLVIKNDKDNRYPILKQTRILKYTSNMTQSAVIADYNMSTRMISKTPIIVGRCNLKSEQERVILEKSLSQFEVTYDTLINYKQYFNDGFVISSSAMNEDEIKHFISDNFTVNPATMLWRVRYAD